MWKTLPLYLKIAVKRQFLKRVFFEFSTFSTFSMWKTFFLKLVIYGIVYLCEKIQRKVNKNQIRIISSFATCAYSRAPLQ